MSPTIQHLVNAQVDINRAVWAANNSKLANDSFQTEAGRDEYILYHAREAIKSLEKVIATDESQFNPLEHEQTK